MSPGPDAPTPHVPGFELGERIGGGGTSEVWAAASEADGRRVAVKVVHADLAEVGAAAREASLSAAAATADVVRVEACLPLDDGRVALVMPWLRGGSLGALVGARGHLEPGEVVTVLAPVASALGRLHAVGVVHGDVAPGNVLLDIDGRPHLADLGVGHVVGEAAPPVWGSDGYVAPEVVLGGLPSPAADVYSVGALGWLCLSGAVPGAPGLRPELSEVSLAAPGPELTALLGVLDRAIDPDATRRPDADTLAWELFGAADAVPLHLVRGADEVSAITHRLRAAASGSRAGPGAHRADRPRRRPRPVSVALGSVAALVLAAMAVVGLGGPPDAGGVAPRPDPSAVVATDDPRLVADAPSTRPRDVLTALTDARAAAWRSASPPLLAEADAPGSRALARDAAALAELRRTGIHYADLRHHVAEVSVVEASGATAVLRARIDTSAYVVEGRGGPERRAAADGPTVLVDLVRGEAGWRVSDIREPSSALREQPGDG